MKLLLAILTVLTGFFQMLQRQGRQRRQDTLREIEHAPHGDDPDLARRWLHERSKADRP
jgi:hypothetical protein